MRFLLKRLSERRIWRKLYRQRISEPSLLNLISLFVFLFGSFRKKVYYDLVLRPHQAFAILKAADDAKSLGLKEISILEFGVANGAGLMNMIEIAEKVTKTTGIKIHIYGFDSGEGMPPPKDFRDHPEYYNTGDFPMNKEKLEKSIEGKATILYGPIKDTLLSFKSYLSPERPIGYVSVDVDYYYSTKDVLELFTFKPHLFLPTAYIYFDDIMLPHHNEKCGELLAIKEFNNTNTYRQLAHHTFFVNQRVFKNADWIKQLYYLHILDHEFRSTLKRKRNVYILDNPYL